VYGFVRQQAQRKSETLVSVARSTRGANSENCQFVENQISQDGRLKKSQSFRDVILFWDLRVCCFVVNVKGLRIWMRYDGFGRGAQGAV
jgi:hypothetical protein